MSKANEYERAVTPRRMACFAAALIGAAAAPAWSQASSEQPAETPQATAPAAGEAQPIPAAERFTVTFSPYVWFTSFNGTQTTDGISVDIDESFLDIVDNADTVFGLMGSLDMTYDRFVFQINGAWSTAEFSEKRGAFRNGEVSAHVDVDSLWAELLGGYRIVDNPIGEPSEHRKFTLDGFGGVRFTSLDVDATFTASTTVTLPNGTVLQPSASREKSDSEDWAEPFVGLRMGWDISEGWSLMVRGDVGGFGAGSDFAWQAVAGIGYRWRFKTWDFALFGGYRALSQDYSNGDFTWDMTVHGPILGMQFTF